MKVERVSYQKAFVIGPYLQEKVGIEIQVDEGETPEEILCIAKATVETWHQKLNPTTLTPEPYNQSPPVIDRKIIEKLEIAIDNAESEEELDKHMEDAAKYGLQVHFQNKKFQLQGIKID